MKTKTFQDLGVATLLIKALEQQGIVSPTPIQEKVIPAILTETGDVVGVAKTGTGKTAAYGIPLLQKIQTKTSVIQALVLVPTRELGNQVTTQLQGFSQDMPEISIVATCGGVPIKPQISRLKDGAHMVVATPGRLIDLIQRDAISLEEVEFVILDEADEMMNVLNEGLDVIYQHLPKKRRAFLFTATLSGPIKQLVQNYLSKKVTHIEVAMENLGHEDIEHQYVVVEPIEKLDVLMHFLSTQQGNQGLIFCKTKAAVNKLGKKLAMNKFSVGTLHGSLSQPIRDRVMLQFREGHLSILVATDLAARGIDVKDLAFVVQYHLPDTYEAYVHRSGRTARAGEKGLSLSVIQEEEREDIPDLEKELGITFVERPKVQAEDLEKLKTLLWARRIFKTKPNRTISEEFKTDVKTIFHHLTKDELIEKMLADHLQETVLSKNNSGENN